MSGPKSTEVTLYIPARNCARTLSAALAGVQAQTADPAEIMLVADARSNDDTLRIARASGLRVIEQREGRLGYARNLALTHCRTPWLASCDADVTLEPDWLTRLMERAEPHVTALSGCTLERLFTDADRWRAVNMPHNWGPLPLDNPFMLISEMLARADALRAVGGYLPDLAYGEDSDLCQRLRHAGFTLRYEPGAVAHHDRRDGVESVLDLRWVYSFHRQRPRFESLPGLAEKLGVNRTYCVQSLSQTLHSPHADTLAISVMLWFHHARRDLLAALARWPLVTAEARNTCVAELWGALDAALVGQWSPLRAPLLICLPDIAAHNAQDCGLAATPGFRAYLASAAHATRDFLAEIPDELVPAILNSAVRMAGETPSGPFERPRLVVQEEDRRRLAQQVRRPAWKWTELRETLRKLSCEVRDDALALTDGPTLPGEAPSGGVAAGARTVVLVPHLEAGTEPAAQVAGALARAEWVVIGYQNPEVLVAAVPILTPRDLACICAAAGSEIRHFYTEAGRTLLVARRTAGLRRNHAAKPIREMTCIR
jgi:glycosyltransferase involved in cell wall biosynthesis